MAVVLVVVMTEELKSLIRNSNPETRTLYGVRFRSNINGDDGPSGAETSVVLS